MTKVIVGPTQWIDTTTKEPPTSALYPGYYGPPNNAVAWTELEPTTVSQVGTMMSEIPLSQPPPPDHEEVFYLQEDSVGAKKRSKLDSKVDRTKLEWLQNRFSLGKRPKGSTFREVLTELLTELPNGGSRIEPIARNSQGLRRVLWGGELVSEDDTPTPAEYAQLRRRFEAFYARDRNGALKWLGTLESRGLNPALVSDLPPIKPETEHNDTFDDAGGSLNWFGTGFTIPGNGFFYGTSGAHDSTRCENELSTGDMVTFTVNALEHAYGPATRVGANQYERYCAWRFNTIWYVFRYYGSGGGDRVLLGSAAAPNVDGESIELTSDGSEHSARYFPPGGGELTLGPFTDSTYPNTRVKAGIFHFSNFSAVDTFNTKDLVGPSTFNIAADHQQRMSDS